MAAPCEWIVRNDLLTIAEGLAKVHRVRPRLPSEGLGYLN
jgi:hypothetical protein